MFQPNHTIELKVTDHKDLLLLWGALNHLQTIGRSDLARNATKSGDIESVWFDEAVDEFDRAQSIKVQIGEYLEDKKVLGGKK